MLNSRGDRASPWYMLHLMLTWAICLELASREVIQNLIQFLMRALSVLMVLYSSKHSSIHACDIESFRFLVVNPGSAQVGILGLTVFRDCPVHQ